MESWWLLPQCFITTSLIVSPSPAWDIFIIPSPPRVPAAFLIKREVRRLEAPVSPPSFCNRAAVEVSLSSVKPPQFAQWALGFPKKPHGWDRSHTPGRWDHTGLGRSKAEVQPLAARAGEQRCLPRPARCLP